MKKQPCSSLCTLNSRCTYYMLAGYISWLSCLFVWEEYVTLAANHGSTVMDEQWVTATTRTVSGTENELCVSEKEAQKHLLLILLFTLSFSIFFCKWSSQSDRSEHRMSCSSAANFKMCCDLTKTVKSQYHWAKYTAKTRFTTERSCTVGQ